MPVAGTVLGRIDAALVDDLPLAAVELAEKARLVTFVARGRVTTLLDDQHYGVGVAVGANLVHDLKIPRLFALAPQLVARAREIARAARRDRLVEGLAIHPADHQHAVAQMVDSD